MNSILQSLVHNKLLKQYFIDCTGHEKQSCHVTRAGNGICLACETDDLFQEFFSGKKEPIIPHKYMFAVWKFANYLAGYQQQDAHEFMICALNGLHQHLGGNASSECNCIIHKIFSGTLKSEVTCDNCHSSSISFDPFLDISLQIPEVEETKKGAKKKRKVEETQKQESSSEEEYSLLSCLSNFTNKETLESFYCSSCKKYHNASKQLTIEKLPSVICFHFKRFKQNIANSSKITTYISFPETLDVSPFLSPDTSYPSKIKPYHLFAVVNHKGQIEKGHYTCFVRKETSSKWFKCDDSNILHATKDQVLQSEAYMLFYSA